MHPLFGLEIKPPPGTNFAQPPLSIDGTPKEKIVMDERAYNPLINHNKKDVATLYIALGVEKELFIHAVAKQMNIHRGIAVNVGGAMNANGDLGTWNDRNIYI